MTPAQLRVEWGGLGGLPVILSYSGGKDSNAAGFALQDAGIPFTAVFCDTGWEAQQTYDYIAQGAPWPVVTVRAVVDLPPDLEPLARLWEIRLGMEYSPMVRTILRKGLFPSRGRKWCTDDLKIKPFAAYLLGLDHDVIAVTGVRAQESATRAAMERTEYVQRYGADMWRPILDWTEEDVIQAHKRAGVQPNPLYLTADIRRVGCWPCINTRKSELAAISVLDPDRLAVLGEMEEWVTQAIASRAEVRGDVMRLDCVGWFHGRADSDRSREYDPIPIARAVEWSTTTQGGRQIGMFPALTARDGCMRWGMCESARPHGGPA